MYPEISLYSFKIDTYVSMYFVAIITASVLLGLELGRNHYSTRSCSVLIFTALVAGFVGSKIYYVFQEWDQFIQNPWRICFAIAGSGWYGGFVLGFCMVAMVLKVEKLPVLKTLDIMVPIVPLAEALGRLGCFFVGCCHGKPSHVPWAVAFPNGLFPPNVKVHPTQLYESILSLGIFLLLWRLRKAEIRSGTKIGLYLVLAGLVRFIIEFYRLEPKVLFELTAPQIFALLGIVLGIYLTSRDHTAAGELLGTARC